MRIISGLLDVLALVLASAAVCHGADDAGRAAQETLAKSLKLAPEQVRVVSAVPLADHHALHRIPFKPKEDEDPAAGEGVLVMLEIPQRREDCGLRAVLVGRDGPQILTGEVALPARSVLSITPSKCAWLQQQLDAFFSALYDFPSGVKRLDGLLARQLSGTMIDESVKEC